MLLNVVVGVAQKNDKILFIKREKGDFIGLWALPGGKLEEDEHINEAVEREFKEETDLNFKFEKLLGIATEIIHDKDSTITFILNICKISLEDKNDISGDKLKWIDIEELKNSKEIVESDLMFLNEFYFNNRTNYLALDCDKIDGKYIWRK